MSGTSPDLQATIPTSPLVWPDTGELRMEWRAFFRRLWVRTGGAPGVPPGTGTITGVTAGNGLVGGGTTGAVTVALNSPVTLANGGTGATAAAQALTNLGGVAKAGDTMTGALVLPSGTLTAPALALGAADGTGWSRSGASVVGGVQGSAMLAMFASGAQFYQPLDMLNNRITTVADATAAQDAMNQRSGDARYAPLPGAWTAFPIDPGYTLVTLRYRVVGTSLQLDGNAAGPLPAQARARLGVLPSAAWPASMHRVPAVVMVGLNVATALVEVGTDGQVWTQWSLGDSANASTLSVSAIVPLN